MIVILKWNSYSLALLSNLLNSSTKLLHIFGAILFQSSFMGFGFGSIGAILLYKSAN